MSSILEKIPLFSVLKSGWDLAAKGYSHDNLKYRRKQQWKIVFHVFMNPFFASKWFQYLKSEEFKNVSQFRPRIYIKPFRTYISIKWNKKQKLKAILDSYRFIKSKGEYFESVISSYEGVVVAQFMMDETNEGKIILAYDDRFRKEGEFVLTLDCEQLGGKIASTAFAIEERKPGEWIGLIACVQGYNTINKTEDAFKIVQKLLHGLRPNSFITMMTQELLRSMGCSEIRCTGNKIQSHLKKHAIHLPWAHKISFDYDKFWEEASGNAIGDGWYNLPLVSERKPIQEVKSNKRSMYNKRYDMLDSLSIKILDKLKTNTN